jgi:hypothetical protein
LISYDIEFRFIENKKPISRDIVDSSSKIVTIDQQRKSSLLLTTEEMSDLEERFDKWMNDRSKKIVDDLFDGLKVCKLNIKKHSINV